MDWLNAGLKLRKHLIGSMGMRAMSGKMWMNTKRMYLIRMGTSMY
jgi:hypothetical protein